MKIGQNEKGRHQVIMAENAKVEMSKCFDEEREKKESGQVLTWRTATRNIF
jgi:hypothetical protein